MPTILVGCRFTRIAAGERSRNSEAAAAPIRQEEPSVECGMPEEMARVVVGIVYAYLGVGVVVALAFVLGGVERADPRARGAGWGFRLVVLPGCAALWPAVLRRWVQGGPPEEGNAHRRAAREPLP